MATNDIKAFAAAGGANVLTQAEYLALAALSTGFVSGKANSKEVNKALRQATLVAAALAQFISDKGAVDVLDNGDVAGLAIKLLNALNKTSQPLDATLTALSSLVGSANKIAYFNGDDTAALTDITDIGRSLIGKTTIADVVSFLNLGATDNYANLGNGYRLIWVKGNVPGGALAAATAVAVSLTFSQAFGTTPLVYWPAVSTPSGVTAGAGIVATCADLTATGMSLNLYNASNANKQITAVIGFAIGKV